MRRSTWATIAAGLVAGPLAWTPAIADDDKPAEATAKAASKPPTPARATTAPSRTMKLFTTRPQAGAARANVDRVTARLITPGDGPNAGVILAEANDVLRDQLALGDKTGVVVIAVEPDGVAGRAGVKPNDVVVKIGDQPLTGPDRLQTILGALKLGSAKLAVVRGGQTVQVKLIKDEGKPDAPKEYWIGVPVTPVDATLRSHLPTLPADAGLVVADVVADSPAAKAGVLKNDILVRLAGKPLTSAESLIAAVQATEGKASPLEVLRAAKLQTVEVTPVLRAQASVVADFNPLWTFTGTPQPGQQTYSATFRTDAIVLSDTKPGSAITLKPGDPQGADRAIAANPYLVYGTVLNPNGTANPIRMQLNTATQDKDVLAALSALGTATPTPVPPKATENLDVRLKELTDKLEQLRQAVETLKPREPQPK